MNRLHANAHHTHCTTDLAAVAVEGDFPGGEEVAHVVDRHLHHAVVNVDLQGRSVVGPEERGREVGERGEGERWGRERERGGGKGK